MSELKPLRIALARGRLLDDSLALLKRIDIYPEQHPDEGRMLALATNNPDIELVVLRGVDIPTCVEQNGAAMGFVGSDILQEYRHSGLHDPIALGIGHCRMVLAAPQDRDTALNSCDGMRIATKYPNVTRDFFSKRGEQVRLIPLYGSMELAPMLGIADYIVDLVDTGKTLQAHGLVPVSELMQVSARLAVNRAAFRLEYERIHPVVNAIAQVVEQAATP